jgi:hypothetical protein
MGLSEFPDTLALVIIHFGNDIGEGNLCIEVPLIGRRCRLFTLLRLLIIAYICTLVKALSW